MMITLRGKSAEISLLFHQLVNKFSHFDILWLSYFLFAEFAPSACSNDEEIEWKHSKDWQKVRTVY